MHNDRHLASLAARNPLRAGLQHSASRRAFMAGMAAGAAATALPSGAAAQDRALALLTWDAYTDPRLVALWKERTGGLPLPLGGNAVRRDLGTDTMRACWMPAATTYMP